MIFQFKQFSIRQRDSAMKVGTDGLLLATSTPLSASLIKVLDVGSGTGLISLVIAQRAAEAKITAIEIEEKAARESAFNFAQSPFKERLSATESSLQEYSSQETFDLIISNPPFFKGSQATGDRKSARNAETLPANELFKAADQLLNIEGQISLIIPFDNEISVMGVAEKYNFFPFQLLRIKGRKSAKVIRSIIHFKRDKSACETSEMHIELDGRHQYSKEYIQLTKDFLTIFD